MKSYKRSNTRGQHSFSRIEGPTIQRSSFNRNCTVKTTFDAGFLIPVFIDEALPGDTMKLKMHNFGRLATPLHPILDNMHLDSFFFSVPYRLVWENWEKFNGAQDDPGDSTDFTIPQISTGASELAEGTVYDYLGLPTEVAGPITFSALPLRALNLIWNEWFRSQDIQDSLPVPKDDGPDNANLYNLQRRGKRHDYFTSCLPFPQKGASVLLPLGDTAPVTLNDSPVTSTGDGIPAFETGGTDRVLHGVAGSPTTTWTGTASTGDAAWSDPKLEVTGATGSADLTAATSATINEIRQAFQIQRLLERDARGGTRYVEMIKSHFGVVSPDFRLQRPEYLGGGTQPINVTPVPQTSETDANTPQANLAAYGTTTGGNHSFIKSFDEHCIVIGLVCLRADLNYQLGMARQWSRTTRFDFFLPALAHLGEQAVLTQELEATGAATDLDVFGYQERWAEYRYKPSMITGQMRSNFAQSLDTWHLAQDFAGVPLLNSSFIEENPPIDRIIATAAEPHLLFDAFFEFTHARPIPTFSTPGMMDHF